MKLAKRILVCLVLLSLCVCTMTSGVVVQATTTDPSEPLIRYDFAFMDEQEEMPILGYMGVPGAAINGSVAPSFLTRANIQLYMDAGFNILSGLYERVPLHNGEVYKALEICEELGLTYFVNDTTYRASYDLAPSTILTKSYFLTQMSDDFYFSSPAFGGIAVRDEPSIHSYDEMANVNSALRELTDNKKIMYTTLFPKGANQYQLGFYDVEAGAPASTWEQYDEYVSSYLAKVDPTILAYDCYTLLKPNSKVSDVNENGGVGTYFRSLSMFRKYANEYNVPFWVTVASHDHVFTHKAIPLKQTQWTVNTSLAYGAKGVQYYTYWNDGVGTGNVNDWSQPTTTRAQGMVSRNGAPTDNYYRIQKINNQIKLIDHVLMKATHKGVMQFGTTQVALVTTDVILDAGTLLDVSGNAFVGCFENAGKDVYYIVSNSADAGVQTFKADFDGKVTIRLTSSNFVTDQNPTGQIIVQNVSSVGFNLSGGEGILVEVL